jgi:hypothetical protein
MIRFTGLSRGAELRHEVLGCQCSIDGTDYKKAIAREARDQYKSRAGYPLTRAVGIRCGLESRAEAPLESDESPVQTP